MHIAIVVDSLCGSTDCDVRSDKRRFLLCANNWFRAIPVRDFAKRWGNHLLRDLLLHPSLSRRVSMVASFENKARSTGHIELAAIMEDSLPSSLNVSLHTDQVSRNLDTRRRYLRQRGRTGSKFSVFPSKTLKMGWERWRDQLGNGSIPSTESGAANLRLILKKMIPSLVPFVVERWSDSCAVLDQVAPLQGGSWAVLTAANAERHGSGSYAVDQAATLDEARQDPVIIRAVAGDAQIYRASVERLRKLHSKFDKKPVLFRGPTGMPLVCNGDVKKGILLIEAEENTQEQNNKQVAPA